MSGLSKVFRTIDTHEFRAKRLELARHEWERSRQSESLECRTAIKSGAHRRGLDLIFSWRPTRSGLGIEIKQVLTIVNPRTRPEKPTQIERRFLFVE